MTPHNPNNFLVEITPEVMGELNRLYMHSDDEPIAELHYSPYWSEHKLAPQLQSQRDKLRKANT